MGKVGQVAIHLIEGKAKGLRLVEYGNWAGRGIGGPAAVWASLLVRPEMEQAGLFFLKRSPSAFQKGVVQVGMAMELRPALQAIVDNPTYTDIVEVLVFVRRWGWENPDELPYLIYRFREIADGHSSLQVLGAASRTVRLPERKTCDALGVDLDHMLDLLTLSGFDWEDVELEKKGDGMRARSLNPSDTAAIQPDELIIGKYHLAEKKGIKATMDIVDGKFIVRKGSHANKREFKGMADNYKKIRLRLVKEGVLIDGGEDVYIFSQDYAFESASTSASVIRGAQTAGPRSWYDENNVSLRGIENDNHSIHGAPEKYSVSGDPNTPLGTYRIIGKHVKATMDLVGKQCLVKRGSQALKSSPGSIWVGSEKIREQLIEKGILVDQGEDHFVFTQDYLFSNVSIASEIVLGRKSRSWKSWCDKDGNFPKKENE